MTKLAMKISGMSCGHCVQAVRRALESVPGVTVDDVKIGTADVTFDDSTTSAEQVTQAVEDEGYAVADAK
jgi:copper chaperone